MSFGGSGGGSSSIAGATDVTLSNPATGEYLGYDTDSTKWQNTSLTGKAALANGGGQENASFNYSVSGAITLDLDDSAALAAWAAEVQQNPRTTRTNIEEHISLLN